MESLQFKTRYVAQNCDSFGEVTNADSALAIALWGMFPVDDYELNADIMQPSPDGTRTVKVKNFESESDWNDYLAKALVVACAIRESGVQL